MSFKVTFYKLPLSTTFFILLFPRNNHSCVIDLRVYCLGKRENLRLVITIYASKSELLESIERIRDIPSRLTQNLIVMFFRQAKIDKIITKFSRARLPRKYGNCRHFGLLFYLK